MSRRKVDFSPTGWWTHINGLQLGTITWGQDGSRVELYSEHQLPDRSFGTLRAAPRI